MAEGEHHHEESLLENISEKIHGGHDSSSSSSDSEDEKKEKKSETPLSSSSSSLKDKIFRLFGREKPVHKVFGGGKRTFVVYDRVLISFFSSFLLAFRCFSVEKRFFSLDFC